MSISQDSYFGSPHPVTLPQVMFTATSLLSPSKRGDTTRSQVDIESSFKVTAPVHFRSAVLRRICVDDAMNRDRDNDELSVNAPGPNMNATRIPALRPQMRWTTQWNTVHIMAPQKTLHTARLSELGSTLANLRVYSAHMGVDMQLANQQLSNSLASATLQTEDQHQNPPVISDQTYSDQVLGKRKFSPSPTSTSNVGDTTEGKSAKRRKAVETIRVSGGLDKEKPGIPATPQRSGLGETMQSELANGRMNAFPHTRGSRRQVAELQSVERISPHTNRNLLAWQPEQVPKTSTGTGASTGPKGLLKSPNPQNHICHSTSHVRGPQVSWGRVLGGVTGMARVLPWSNVKIDACTLPVRPNRSHKHVNKIELIRMHNEIGTCIFLCEHGKASVKEEEKLLKVLDEVMGVSRNPGLTLEMLADVRLGMVVRRLLADDRYGLRVKGKARTIMNMWKRSFGSDRRYVKSRLRVHKSDQSMDP